MIQVFLDGEPLVVAQDASIGLSVSIARIEDPTSASSSGTKTIKIPMIRENIAAFRHCEEILSPEIFNNSEHTARVEQDGIELISGKAFLERITRYQDGTGYYEIQTLGNEFDWVNRIKDKAMNELNDTDKISQYARYATLTDAQRANAFFALLDHGCWWQEVGGETVRRNWATYADLMPFVNLRAILNEIFKGYDITIEGSGIAAMLDLLYVTGQFKKSENASVLAEDNDFTVTTELLNGDDKGIIENTLSANGVYTSQDLQAFDTIEEDDNGRITIEGTEENRDLHAVFRASTNCVVSFSIIVNYKTSLAFDYALIDAVNSNSEYTGTLVTISDYPRFIDVVSFGKSFEAANEILRLTYSDSNEWAKKDLITGSALEVWEYFPTYSFDKSYKNISIHDCSLLYAELPDYENYESIGFARVRTEYNRNSETNEITQELTVSYIATKKISSETFFFLGTAQRQQIQQLESINRWFDESVDIAMKVRDSDVYVGINKDGNTYDLQTNTVSIRSEKIKLWNVIDSADEDGRFYFNFNVGSLSVGTSQNPNVPYALRLFVKATKSPTNAIALYDNNGYFIGYTTYSQISDANIAQIASLGTVIKFTTEKDCKVSPKFNNVVLYGTNVSMNDIGGDASAVDMLKSIMQLFNLRIYTNSDTKSVHLIPFDEFYTSNEVDWTNRVDYDQNIEISGIGDNVGNKLVLSYQESSAPVSEYNERHTAPLNSYSVDLASKTSDGEKEVQNAVFNPPVAMRASGIFEADKPTGNAADTSAWILETVGKDTKDTIDGIDYELPRTLVLLNDSKKQIGCYGVLDNYEQPDMETTADLDFAKSLHRHYDKQVDIWNSGKQITCYCRILPQEIEALRKYGMHAKINFRSKFRIHLFGEDLLCRLQSVENYEPSKATCKCTFIYWAEEPEPQTYNYTMTLNDITSNVAIAGTVNGGEPFTAVLTARSGFNMDAVTVIMGGADITSEAWTLNADGKSGTVTIARITGDVTITATATVEQTVATFYNYIEADEPIYVSTNENEIEIPFEGAEYIDCGATFIVSGDPISINSTVLTNSNNEVIVPSSDSSSEELLCSSSNLSGEVYIERYDNVTPAMVRNNLENDVKLYAYPDMIAEVYEPITIPAKTELRNLPSGTAYCFVGANIDNVALTNEYGDEVGTYYEEATGVWVFIGNAGEECIMHIN